jgi:hypothetical protein
MGDHNGIIKKIAKQELARYGFIQKGSSRTFLRDRGWYLVIVEFQPKTNERGTFLNLGICWLWDRNDHLSYDVGGRAGGFVAHTDDAGFGSDIMKLCSRAAREAEACVKQFPSVEWVLRHYRKHRGDLWHHYHGLIAALLMEERKEAARFMEGIGSTVEPYDWVRGIQEDAALITGLSHPELLALVRRRIGEKRAALRCPEMADAGPVLRG